MSVGICFVIRMTGALELTREEEHGGSIEKERLKQLLFSKLLTVKVATYNITSSIYDE